MSSTRDGRAADAVASFARAAARLADPFAVRGNVLAELGIDDERWKALEAQWYGEMARRTQAGDPTLADRFRNAYAEARAAITAERLSAAKPPSKVAAVARGAHGVDTTADAVPTFKPALPFRGRRPPPPPAATPQHERAEGDVDGTVLLEKSPIAPRLPFDDPDES